MTNFDRALRPASALSPLRLADVRLSLPYLGHRMNNASSRNTGADALGAAGYNGSPGTA
jgi:hypothetical protein